MKIGMVSNIQLNNNYSYTNKYQRNFNYSQSLSSDVLQKENVVSLSNIKQPFNITKSGKYTHISFCGSLKAPELQAIQMKVKGVSYHQNTPYSTDENVAKLAQSDWYDGKKLDYEIRKIGEYEKIILKDKDFREIGSISKDVAPSILKILKKYGNDCSFRLTNILSGNSTNSKVIGVRAALMYEGNDEKIQAKIQRTFEYLLNSEDVNIKDNVMFYQEKTSPAELLKTIFDIAENEKGSEYAESVNKAIETICYELNNPDNKSILLLGHTSPDDDAIGCVLALQAAISSNYPDKKVVSSIDDKIPSGSMLYGIDNIKRPYNESLVSEYENNIKFLETQEQDKSVEDKINLYKKELEYLKNPDNFFDYKSENSTDNNYDLVILMDTPDPKRFSSSYKKYIENAKNVIFIDHHTYRPDIWNNEQDVTGVNMKEIEAKNMSLVIPGIPAASELVAIISHQAGLLNKLFHDNFLSKQFVSSVISGISSDTGSFLRTANLSPDDLKKANLERPNYKPEGFVKWLISKSGNNIDKKWLRENVLHGFSEQEIKKSTHTAQQKLIDYSLESLNVYPEVGLGIINVDYENINDIWQSAYNSDGKTTLNDVQNMLKFSGVMSALRDAPVLGKTYEVEPYKSKYQNDKIAVLITQDEKEGFINSNSKISKCNGLRFSFRSVNGTNYAEILAGLFNGGGHGSAAGGRIDLPGIDLNSLISIKIDENIEKNPAKIYKALKDNYQVRHNIKKSDMLHKFETVIDSNGKSIQDSIKDIVLELRNDNCK